jgi:nucleoside-diphosphate-sugar epimerase
MLQEHELREALHAAAELANRIAERFRAGDSAEVSLRQLAEKVAAIRRLAAQAGKDLPEDCRAEITQLLGLFQVTITEGDGWLTQAGSELATDNLRQRLRRAYGLRPRDD